MKKTNKILLVLFILLLIISASEAGYYLFSQKQPPITVKKNLTTNSLPKDSNSAINSEVLSSLSFLKKGVLLSSVLDSQFRGSVIEVNSSGGTTKNGFQYKLKIVILGQNGLWNSFYFTENELSKIKFLEKNVETIKAINLTDLRKGDIILLNEKLDITKDSNNSLISCEITKINGQISQTPSL